MKEKWQALAGAWLCRGLDSGEVDALFSAAVPRTVAAGQVVLRMGQKNSSIFVLSSGSAQVTRPGTEDETVLAVLDRGRTFGEMSALDGSATSSTVTATTALELLELPLASLDRLAAVNPPVWGKLWRNLALDLKHRLVKTNELVDHYVDLAQVLRSHPELAEQIAQG